MLLHCVVSSARRRRWIRETRPSIGLAKIRLKLTLEISTGSLTFLGVLNFEGNNRAGLKDWSEYVPAISMRSPNSSTNPQSSLRNSRIELNRSPLHPRTILSIESVDQRLKVADELRKSSSIHPVEESEELFTPFFDKPWLYKAPLIWLKVHLIYSYTDIICFRVITYSYVEVRFTNRSTDKQTDKQSNKHSDRQRYAGQTLTNNETQTQWTHPLRNKQTKSNRSLFRRKQTNEQTNKQVD